MLFSNPPGFDFDLFKYSGRIEFSTTSLICSRFRVFTVSLLPPLVCFTGSSEGESVLGKANSNGEFIVGEVLFFTEPLGEMIFGENNGCWYGGSALPKVICAKVIRSMFSIDVWVFLSKWSVWREVRRLKSVILETIFMLLRSILRSQRFSSFFWEGTSSSLISDSIFMFSRSNSTNFLASSCFRCALGMSIIIFK